MILLQLRNLLNLWYSDCIIAIMIVNSTVLIYILFLHHYIILICLFMNANIHVFNRFS